MKQNHKVESLNSCIKELQQQTCAQRFELQDAHHGYAESRREQVRLQEELAMKGKAPRDTQIRCMHIMGEMKRAQELRFDEFSVHKLRESHDTIQGLTSQIQALQERMNCMNDSGEFQEVESNYCGKNSHVPSQPAVIPSPRSMLCCDKRVPLDTWNLSGSQENVFGQSTFYVRVIANALIRNSSLYDTKCYKCGSSACLYRDTCCKRWRTNLKHNPNADICRMAVSTVNSFLPVDIPQNSMVGQQRQQISELQFEKFSTHSTFSCWKIRFKNQVTTCSDFPSEAMLWIKEVEIVDSVDEIKSSRSTAGKNFTKFEMLDAKIASALNEIIQNSHFQKKVSLEEQKAQKEDRFLRGRQIVFMIYDYFGVTGPHDTLLDYADLFYSSGIRY